MRPPDGTPQGETRKRWLRLVITLSDRARPPPPDPRALALRDRRAVDVRRGRAGGRAVRPAGALRGGRAAAHRRRGGAAGPAPAARRRGAGGGAASGPRGWPRPPARGTPPPP